jgi:hypothetical protein
VPAVRDRSYCCCVTAQVQSAAGGMTLQTLLALHIDKETASVSSDNTVPVPLPAPGRRVANPKKKSDSKAKKRVWGDAIESSSASPVRKKLKPKARARQVVSDGTTYGTGASSSSTAVVACDAAAATSHLSDAAANPKGSGRKKLSAQANADREMDHLAKADCFSNYFTIQWAVRIYQTLALAR